jgi:pimeloyl-ACP methyl ester carboxylesterase
METRSLSHPRRRTAAILGIALLVLCLAWLLWLRLGARDASPHRESRVVVHGVPVDALDWGGEGPSLTFIPGFGNTAHIFDDFAPRFVDRFRVVGITRVGFGASDPPKEGYDIASRVEQIRAVLDALGIARTVLVGHSLGGDELTAFAGTYPERTAGLIYLDAATDHVKALQWEDTLARYATGVPEPSFLDKMGPRAYQRLIERQTGVRYPLGEILATTRFHWTGWAAGSTTPPWVFEATRAAVQPPDYSRVHAPALALCSDWDTAADILPWLRNDPATNARATAALKKKVLPESLAERARFAREVQGAQIVTFRAHHYSFLSHPQEVERRMRGFLASLPG